MAHPEHREIRTERLILRPLRFGDVDDVFGYANDEEWARYLITVPWPYERRDAVTYIASQVASPPEPGACHLAMELDGRVVGTIGLHARGEGVAELGYGLARAQWGRGLVPEAARTMLSHGFEAYDLQTILRAHRPRQRRLPPRRREARHDVRGHAAPPHPPPRRLGRPRAVEPAQAGVGSGSDEVAARAAARQRSTTTTIVRQVAADTCHVGQQRRVGVAVARDQPSAARNSSWMEPISQTAQQGNGEGRAVAAAERVELSDA